jgi:hypothetical protein
MRDVGEASGEPDRGEQGVSENKDAGRSPEIETRQRKANKARSEAMEAAKQGQQQSNEAGEQQSNDSKKQQEK